MNNYESDYFKLLFDVLSNGKKSSNRTGINTRKVWGRQTHIDLSLGFPLLTTKKIHWKSVVHELLWMISGDTNIRYLLQNGVTFWTEWPYQSYLEYYEGKGIAISVEGGTFYGVNDDRSHRPFTQKEFEQRIVSDEIFSLMFGGIGKFAYGGLWRRFPTVKKNVFSVEPLGIEVDQLSAALNDLKTNPDSRRIIISAWHPYHSNRKEDAVLPACHNYIQFGTEELTWDERHHIYIGKMSDSIQGMTSEDFDRVGLPKYRLNCYYSMRSSDVPLGMPYNVAFYALFTHIVAHCSNMIVGRLVHNAADVHIYENQIDGIKEQLARSIGELPHVKIKESAPKDIFSIKYEDIELIGYNPQPRIFIPVAV